MVTVSIPSLPPALGELIRPENYEVRYLGRDGAVENEFYDRDLIVSGELQIRVQKHPWGPIVVRFGCTGFDANELCCGGLYPIDSETAGSIKLRWEDGFICTELLRYASVGGDLHRYNVPRLRDAVLEKSNGNPWLIDREAIATALEHGVLSSRSIRTAELRPVRLPLPDGTWRRVNPVCEGEMEASFGVLETEICDGYQELVRVPDGDVASIFAGLGEWTLNVNRGAERIESGKL